MKVVLFTTSVGGRHGSASGAYRWSKKKPNISVDTRYSYANYACFHLVHSLGVHVSTRSSTKFLLGECNVEDSNKNSIHQSQSTLDRLVRLNSSSSIRSNSSASYSYWNKPNTTRFGYWGSPMDRSSVHCKVPDRSNQEVNLNYCIKISNFLFKITLKYYLN